MNDALSDKIGGILKQGHSLAGIGVDNWAFKRKEALAILNEFLRLNISILGGDVCETKDGVIRYNYDNWYCEKKQEESQPSFVLRSIEAARIYITNYKSMNLENISFAFVLEG